MITKKLKLLVASTALMVGGLSGFALANGHMGGGPRKAMIEKFDANKDGKLDDAERAAMHEERVAKRFAMLDTNKDGAITLAEMKAAKPHGKGHGRGHHRGGFRGGMTE